MIDEEYGSRDKRGDWSPSKHWEYPPVFTWPPKPLKLLAWLPGFLFRWNLFYAVVAVGVWFALPPMETFKTFELGWIAYILAMNLGMTLVFFSFFHVRLYIKQRQDIEFKYNGKWLAKDNPHFLFKNQTWDNIFYTLASGVPIWTAWEVLTLWLYANAYIPQISFAEHPIAVILLFVAVPVWRDLHFYLIHRLIHWPPLYKLAHHVHHRNVNIGPWSGLSMHPLEHLLYFSCVALHYVIASHPVNAIYNLVHAGLGPAPVHAGYDKLVVQDGKLVDLGAWDHYLHHKYYEVNYADGVFPFDKWFGTFHDGSKEADERMKLRFQAKKAKIAAKQAST